MKVGNKGEWSIVGLGLLVLFENKRRAWWDVMWNGWVEVDDGEVEGA